MSGEPTLKEFAPEDRYRAAAVDVVVSREDWQRKHRRPSALTAREALMVLEFEATFVAVCSSNLAKGMELSESDHQRLWLAQSRISCIVDEVARR